MAGGPAASSRAASHGWTMKRASLTWLATTNVSCSVCALGRANCPGGVCDGNTNYEVFGSIHVPYTHTHVCDVFMFVLSVLV